MIGKQLKTIRQQAELTQTELCKKIGINAGYLSMIENGLRNPSIQVVEKICKELGYSVEFVKLPVVQPAS